jgi:hypothetical protein
MIVKIGAGGKSFKGLSEYLTHDPEAKTEERVAWTHTHNLANDHVPSAVDEMLWTAREAELLKQEAGIRAGGRATENAVKHISLNWSPDDRPTREDMIETSEKFLTAMRWNEHQAIFVAHDDKAYSHVHIMLNVVHPETGLRLNDDFERRRAQDLALGYEQEQGRVYCEQRLKPQEERENSPPRNIWMEFQEKEKEFYRAESNLRQDEGIRVDYLENQRNEEWKILKEIQRLERTEFFAQGKSEFSELRSSIYRDVRKEFRNRWAEFYAAQQEGGEPEIFAARKAALVAEQKAVLEPRRDAACQQLRESRDLRYRGILDRQQEARADLSWRQDIGLDNAPFFHDLAERRDAARGLSGGFRGAAYKITGPFSPGDAVAAKCSGVSDTAEDWSAPVEKVDTAHIGSGLAKAAGSLLDSLFFDVVTLGGASTNPAPRSSGEIFQAAADDAQKRQQHDLEKVEVDWRERQKALYRE